MNKEPIYSAKIGTLQKTDHKYFERVQTWCGRRTEISWTDRVESEDVLHSVKKGGKIILRTIKRSKANCICHITLSQEEQKEREDEEEDVSNYWKTLRKQEYAGI
jgi:hypothetical protein